MKMSLIVMVMGIFLIIPVSAIYGGETTTVTFDFEPVACSVTDNLVFDIIAKDVNIDLPINFLGNFTLTCFSGEEADPVIIYRGGGGSRTIYQNVTVYEDKIVEVQVVPIEKIKPKNSSEVEVKKVFEDKGKILVGCLIFIIIILLIWIITHPVKQEVNDIVKKGGENKNE